MNAVLRNPRSLEAALSDLIIHRATNAYFADERIWLDRMISDLEAEAILRRTSEERRLVQALQDISV